MLGHELYRETVASLRDVFFHHRGTNQVLDQYKACV